jgi:phospholipase/carboxylesterase
MSADRLETVQIDPEGEPDAVVILLHGLGADGHDLEPIVPELPLPQKVRWVLPHAPVREITLNGGEPMPAWYDIEALDVHASEDEAGIRESARAIGSLIDAERERGIAAGRIVLAGFSQGGAIAMFTALRRRERLAGLIALSCYMPLPATLAGEAHPSNARLHVFMAHGTRDPVVSLELGVLARDLLLARGCPVEWHTYPLQHGVSGDELADLREWLLRLLAGGRPGEPATA